ncbi:unnamed protein product [Withania somnifera]
MNNTSASTQNQRVKATNAKEVFQFIFVVVIYIWFVYRIQNSQEERIRNNLIDDSEHEDNSSMEKPEYVASRDDEEFQANETETENFGNEVQTFDDENGIPEDVRDVNYTITESNDELKTNPHMEVTSNLDGERLRSRFRI